MFEKATRKKSKLRLLLTGASGSGKTFSALQLAKGIVPGGKIACIDTEHGSASLYSDQADFSVLELSAPYSPEHYIEAINAAETAGFDLLIIDSITHEWNGKGGILEIHDTVTKTIAKGNSYTAWASITPRHNAFVDRILQSKIHVICTLRSKADFVLETNSHGKQTPKKVGMAPIQREGIEYEFTTALDLSLEGNLATASKDRTRLFRDPQVITVDTGTRLLAWLESGEAAKPEWKSEQLRIQNQTTEEWLADYDKPELTQPKAEVIEEAPSKKDESRKSILRVSAALGVDSLRTAWEAVDAETKHRLGGVAFLKELKTLAGARA